MVSKYLQKAPCRISSQTDTVWPSISSQTAKSSLSAARTSDAATHQTKHMSSFCMLSKGCMSNFRSFRQRLTRFWCSEAKSSLPAAKLPGTMAPKSELMDHLKTRQISGQSDIGWPYIKAWHLPHGEIKSSIDGTPNGFKTQVKAHDWSYLMSKKLHLKFQVIPTSFDPVSTLGRKSATESSAFPKNRKLCALICTAFLQVFFRGIKPINEEKCQRKI